MSKLSIHVIPGNLFSLDNSHFGIYFVVKINKTKKLLRAVNKLCHLKTFLYVNIRKNLSKLFKRSHFTKNLKRNEKKFNRYIYFELESYSSKATHYTVKLKIFSRLPNRTEPNQKNLLVYLSATQSNIIMVQKFIKTNPFFHMLKLKRGLIL